MEQKPNSAVISGKVIVNKLDENSPNYPKRIVVVDTGGDYPKQIPVTFGGKSVDKPENLRVGDVVNLHVNIGGREWNGKYYGSIDGWKIDILSNGQKPIQHDARHLAGPQSVEQRLEHQQENMPKQATINVAPAEDDMPF